LKLSPDKRTWPGRKQVWRSPGDDVVALAAEPGPEGARPLLVTVFDGGPTGAAGSLADARARCGGALAAWTGEAPVVRISAALEQLTVEAAAEVTL
jgi:nicotinate phosphoribosyltransferase